MEVVLGIAILVLFVWLITLKTRIDELTAEAKSLRLNDGVLKDEIAELRAGSGVRSPAEKRRPRRVAPRRIDVAPAAAMSVAPPSKVIWTEPVDTVLDDAVPGLGVARAVTGIAQSVPRRPSVVERGMGRLRGTEEWEALIGGRLLNRIGAVALILGLAFFFKYAVDQNLISQGMRVIAGLVAGAVLLVLAYRSHGRGLAIFGQGLVGAGLAMLYLSVYASFNFYHLVPQPLALAGMGAITAAAFVQALYYDSLAVSLLACAGGYATPFLLDSGGSALGTVAYVLLVDIGALAVVSRRKAWFVLEPIAMLATYAIYFTWYATSYTGDEAGLAVTALSLFWALFLAFDAYSLLWPGEMQSELRHVLGGLNSLIYYSGLFLIIGPQHRSVMAVLTLAIGAVHVALLLLVRRRQKLDLWTAARYTASAMTLLALATAIEFRGFIVVTFWALEALPLVWLGTRARLSYVWRPALVLYALGLSLLFATPDALVSGNPGGFRPLLNERALAFLVLAASCAAATIPFSGMRRERSEIIERSLHYAWMALVFILLAVETNDLFQRFMLNVSPGTAASYQYDRSLAVATLWMALSLGLLFFGLRLRILPWLYGALAAGSLSVGLAAVTGIAYEPIERFVPVLNLRVAVFAVLLAALALHFRWLRAAVGELPWLEAVRVVVQSLMLLLPFELLTAEINDYFQHRMGHPVTSMDEGGAFIELALLAAVWTLYGLLPTWYGVRKRIMPLVAIGLSMTAAATGLAAFAGTVFQPAHQLSTLLGVRPVVLALLVAGLMTQLRLLRGIVSTYQWTAPVTIAIQAAIILTGFALITAETRDAFTLRISSGGSAASNWRDLERLAFSLVWLGYGILVIGLGIWRRVLWMRVGALVLFAFVIVKVFVYDLSFLGAVYRPVSFACLGIILLAVSYLYGRYRDLLFDTGTRRQDVVQAEDSVPPTVPV